jgi:hypothetical protein
LVGALADRLRPAAILIEGPSDFNDRISELALPHRLPIAIYSFARLPSGRRVGAYYPFCIYSPEWQALRAAQQFGVEARFIDLPWADIATEDELSHRYADAELRRSAYVESLCRKLGVENFDDLWDTLFEIDATLTVEEYLERCHHLCYHVRLFDGEALEVDYRREAFMASEIRRAMEKHSGRLLVVTGGYHSFALYARLTGMWDSSGLMRDDLSSPISHPSSLISHPSIERGIALTPYSYERLDKLTGYEAGVPNPGFYHQVWQERQGSGLTPKSKIQNLKSAHHQLLAQVVKALRQRGQLISAADLIAAETTAQGLAALRGHAEVWRWDLVDGLTSALVKEELAYGCAHPLLDAVHEVLRGGERGQLAEGTALPPLVQDIKRLLSDHELEAEMRFREVELDLSIEGDLSLRDDLSRVWERWRIRWTPDFDATCIEAARYGPTLAEATEARLTERSDEAERDAEKAALLLLDAALAGFDALAGALHERLTALIRQDGNFFTVISALNHLLYLYRYDVALQTTGRGDIGALLREAFGRGLWLLESLGQVAGEDRKLLFGVRVLLDTFERCAEALELSHEEFVSVLRRVEVDTTQTPVVRGAAVGALWTLGAADAEQACADMRYFADPARLGDFLTGLFCLAREVVQRQKDLLLSVDGLLMGYTDEEFLTALPALRLAFTFFTPREKHHIALNLLEALGLSAEQPLTALEVDATAAAQAFAFEARLFAAAERYGLRGGES